MSTPVGTVETTQAHNFVKYHILKGSTTTQKPLSRFEFNDRMHLLKTKLRFITDAIVYWNVNTADINEDATFGFGLFMDEIIEEMDECIQQLKE